MDFYFGDSPLPCASLASISPQCITHVGTLAYTLPHGALQGLDKHDCSKKLAGSQPTRWLPQLSIPYVSLQCSNSLMTLKAFEMIHSEYGKLVLFFSWSYCSHFTALQRWEYKFRLFLLKKRINFKNLIVMFFSVNQSVQFNIENFNIVPSEIHVLSRRTMCVVSVFLLIIHHVFNKIVFCQI